MFANLPLLSLMIWIPILGGIMVLMTGNDKHATQARIIAIIIALINMALCIPLYLGFNTHTAAMQFTEHLNWINAFHIHYDLGVDGISLPLIILTNYTTLLVILASWETIHEKVAQYVAAFLVMQGMVVGVFASLDSILFYLFWEGMLIPMYLSIGIWGAENRSYAAIKFFLYTFLASALMLAALLYLGVKAQNFHILSFYTLHLSMPEQLFIFFAFLLAFAVKIPMWPVHTWLPDAHTEAPAGGSVVLAALMLKMGAYGFLRFSLPIVPNACQALAPLMVVLSLISIVYIGFIALAQTDMKKLIAYSSIAHMGFVTLGCFMIYNIIEVTGDMHNAFMSLEGALVQMISHAFGSGAMFLAFGMLYERMHSRSIKSFGGVAHTMPVFAAFFMVFAMSNVGLPGTSGFVGEFMILLSTFKASFWITLLAASTLFIGAAYTLWMYKRVFFGPVVHEQVAILKDVGWLDKTIFVLLVIPIAGIGLYPAPLLNVFNATVSNLLTLSMQTKLGLG